MPNHIRRVAANPIPYWLNNGVVDKSRPVLDKAFSDLAAIGFDSVKADVPPGMSVTEYLDWIGGHGLAPAVSLYNSTFDRRVPGLPNRLQFDQDIEAAKVFASQQLSLGLDRTMLCAIFVPERLARPGVGADFDEERLQSVIQYVGAVAEALVSEGVTPYLHPHIGGWIETEYEVRSVLDAISPSLLGFGPDTGHLFWGGTDPVKIIRDYSSRVGAIHVKDVYPDLLSPEAQNGRGYWEITATKRMWAEPGRGIVDLDGAIDALPTDYDGDLMIEVDVPSLPTVYESFVASYEWAAQKFAK